MTGGARVAVADFTGDNIPDVVAGTGPGGRTQVRVLDRTTGQELFAIAPFESVFTGGVFAAAGDLDGDGFADLIAGGSRVLTLSGADLTAGTDRRPLATVDVPGGAGPSGTPVAAQDLDGDGRLDLLVGSGNAVTLYRSADLSGGGEFRDFDALPGAAGGVYVG